MTETQSETLPQTDPQTQGETQPQTPTPEPRTATFLVLTQLPYVANPFMNCCSDGRVTVIADPDGRTPGDVLIEHEHSNDCEVWRIVP